MGEFYKDRLGRLGEEKACLFLKKKGYRIIQRNWRSRFGEIDIVAAKAGVYIFVEVKSGRESQGFRPETHFDQRKSSKLLRISEFYLLKNHGRLDWPRQIDLVSIVFNERDEVESISHFENVVSDSY